LAEGYTFRDVAAKYAVSKTALHRHWQAHVAAEPVGAAVRASGTATPQFGKWALWPAGILGVLWWLGRAGQAGEASLR
jgi:hypothetical protein